MLSNDLCQYNDLSLIKELALNLRVNVTLRLT